MSIGIRSSGHFRYKTLANYQLNAITICACPSKFISLKLLRLSATEASLVHKIRELLVHQLFDFLDGLLETLFTGTGDVQVKRRVLSDQLATEPEGDMVRKNLPLPWPCAYRDSSFHES